MDVISLEATLIKGSHGRPPTPGKEASEAPVFVSSSRAVERDEIPLTAVKEMLLEIQFG